MGSVGERIEHYSSNMRLLVDKVSDHPGLLDTSELLRPEAILKEKEAFRDYTKNDGLCDGETQDLVEVQPHGGDHHGSTGHAQRAGGRERPGPGLAEHSARVPNCGEDPGGAPGQGVVPAGW